MTSTTQTFLLDEDRAAIKLGITKELLYAYVRYAPKISSGDNRKLTATRKNRIYYFSEQDLDEWDGFLRQPWSEPNEKRPTVPSYIEDYLKVESGAQCALCGYGHKLNTAHIVEYASTRSHHHHNLIRLCSDCHIKYDEQIIPSEEIIRVKDHLVQKIRENIINRAGLLNQPPAAMNRLPHPKPIFVGRDVELENLKAALAEARVTVIEGIGGIGKTQLALQALRQDNVATIWVEVENVGSFSDLQTILAAKLYKNVVLFDETSSFFEALSEKRVRVVLDGVDRFSEDEREKLLDFLENFLRLTNSPKILITTQIEFRLQQTSFRRIKLSPLSSVDSRLVLLLESQNLQGVSISAPDAEWLADFCEGHPLSLQIAAGLIGYYKKSETVVHRLDATADGAAGKELKDPSRRTQNRSTSLEACLRAAYECFSQPQKRLLLYLSNFPGGCLETKAAHWHDATEDFSKDLAETKRFFFVEAAPDEIYLFDRLRLLNPVAQFVKSQWLAADLAEVEVVRLLFAEECRVEAAIIRKDCLESANFSEVQFGLYRIDAELPNYLAALEYALRKSILMLERGEDAHPYQEVIAYLSSSLSKYFFVRGVFSIGIQYLQIGILSHEDLAQFDSAATDYAMLASLQYRTYDYEGHRKTTQELLALAERTGDARAAALASLCLGQAADKNGEFREAIAHYEKAAAYFEVEFQKASSLNASEKLGEDYNYFRGMIGIASSGVGRAYERLNLPAEALSFHQRALDLALQANDFANVGSSYHAVGNCNGMLGRSKEAIAAYKSGVEYFYQLNYRQFLSNALGELGEEIVVAGFDADTEEFLSDDLIQQGLQDIKSEFILLTAKAKRPVEDDLFILRKFFGIAKLIGFTKNAGVLPEWIQSFGSQIIEPLLAEEEFGESDSQKRSFVHFLNLIASLAYGWGEIVRDETELNEEAVFRLCKICFLIDDAPRFKPFEWLAAVLNQRDARPHITANLLKKATRRAIERLDPKEFKIF